MRTNFVSRVQQTRVNADSNKPSAMRRFATFAAAAAVAFAVAGCAARTSSIRSQPMPPQPFTSVQAAIAANPHRAATEALEAIKNTPQCKKALDYSRNKRILYCTGVRTDHITEYKTRDGSTVNGGISTRPNYEWTTDADGRPRYVKTGETKTVARVGTKTSTRSKREWTTDADGRPRYVKTGETETVSVPEVVEVHETSRTVKVTTTLSLHLPDVISSEAKEEVIKYGDEEFLRIAWVELVVKPGLTSWGEKPDGLAASKERVVVRLNFPTYAEAVEAAARLRFAAQVEAERPHA